MGYTFNSNDVVALAHSLGADTKTKGDELFFKYCPYCEGGDSHDKETFSINLKTGAFKCFRSSCDRHGHFVEFARDKNFPLDFGYKPKHYKKLEQKKIEVRDAAVEYLKSRGISQSTAKRYSITTRTDKDNVLVFPFYDDKGVMVAAKYRKTDFDKDRGDKNKEWFEKDTMPILFGMWQCKDFSRLIITEGQLDSLTVAECGIDNAVSVPTGANGFTWIDNCYDWVHKFDEIIIFGDCEKDKITLVDGIAQRFPDKKIKAVRRADYLGEKDANDILRKYGRDSVIKCVENAEIKPVLAVKKLSAVKKVDLERLEHIKTGIYGIDKAINGFYFGQVVLLTGKRGEGKSTLASQVCANALDQGYSIFAYSGELPDFHFKSWLDRQIAGIDHIESYTNDYGRENYYLRDETVEIINAWYDERAYIFDNNILLDDKHEEVELLTAIEKACCRYGIKFVLIDNLMTALEVEPTADLYRAQSEFIKKLKRLATRLEIVILIVAHPRKEMSGKELDNDSVSGSSDITNAVDIVLTYSTNDDKDDIRHNSVIGIPKNRLTGIRLIKGDRVKVTYSSISKRIICDNDNPRKIYGCFANSMPNDLPEEPPF